MRFLRRLYDWVLSWAERPHGAAALFILAFAESSFFPIPPDILLIALAVSIPVRSFRFAAICSAGSVLGGAFGYYIGVNFMDIIGGRIIEAYGFGDKFELVKGLYQEYDAIAVGIAGFTPIPYKVFTIAAGAFDINFIVFLAASAASRSLRFFILAALIYKFGGSIKDFIDKYFNLLTIAFTILLVLGFVVIKFLV